MSPPFTPHSRPPELGSKSQKNRALRASLFISRTLSASWQDLPALHPATMSESQISDSLNHQPSTHFDRAPPWTREDLQPSTRHHFRKISRASRVPLLTA